MNGRGKYGGGGPDSSSARDDDALASAPDSNGSVLLAVIGCLHGEIDAAYASIRSRLESINSRRSASGLAPVDVSAVVVCGDNQTLRNRLDFRSLACPEKYKRLGDFHRYYSGEKSAPYLTICVGGNHECSTALQELPLGGWLAKDLYYMGDAGCVNLKVPGRGRLRIGGLSGIFKGRDFLTARTECPPYSPSALRSVYHVRRRDVQNLCALSGGDRMDVVVGHDWPRGIYDHGDAATLLRKKPFFRDEVQRGELGSPAAKEVMETVRPRYWFGAHLHVRFEATVRWGDGRDDGDGGADSAPATTRFIAPESECAVPGVESLTEQMTRFLALDKCLPRRSFMTFVSVDTPETFPDSDIGDGPPYLEYDAPWLAVASRSYGSRTGDARPPAHDETARIATRFGGDLRVPQNFVQTVPTQKEVEERGRGGPGPSKELWRKADRGEMVGNPQTDWLLGALGLDHRGTVPWCDEKKGVSTKDANEINIDSDDEDQAGTVDANEIDLDDDGTDEGEAQDTNEIDLDDDDEKDAKETNRVDLDVDAGRNVHDQVATEAVSGTDPNNGYVGVVDASKNSVGEVSGSSAERVNNMLDGAQGIVDDGEERKGVEAKRLRVGSV